MDINIQAFINSGLIPLPINLEGKNPAGGFSQGEWYKAAPDDMDIHDVWARYGGAATAVGLICGHGTELIDIDTKNDPDKKIAERYLDAIRDESEALFRKLTIATSKSGGTHIWLKLSDECERRKSTALAVFEYTPAQQFEMQTDRHSGVVIETRGVGGYGLCPPSPGYEPIQGSIFDIEPVTDAERELLWDIARSFNTYVKPVSFIRNERVENVDDKPGADYANRVDVLDVVNFVVKHGWTFLRQRGNTIYLNRPGAPHKHTSAIILQDKRLFVNYSTSIPEFVEGAGYSFWRVYAIMAHAGDFAAAAKALASQGYGKQAERTYTPEQAPSEPADDVLSRYQHLLFDVDKPPSVRFDFWVVTPPKNPLHEPERTGVSFPGALIPVVGKQKSRKTTVLTAIIAAALTGVPTCVFMHAQPKRVLWIDTEQPQYYFWLTMWRIAVQAYGEISNLHSYWLRKMSPKERMKAIQELVDAIKPDIVVIDGINDVFLSMNKEEVVNEVVNDWLMPIADKGITVFTVLHLNKGDGNMAGWVGTILGKKSDGTLQVEAEGPREVKVRMRDARTKPFDAFILRTDLGMHGILYDERLGKPDYDYSSAIEDDHGALVQPPTGADNTYESAENDYPPMADDEDVPF